MTQFQKYSSLVNHYEAKFLNKAVMNGLAEDNIRWVATEKVHGANYGMWYDGTTHRKSKRSGIFEGAFFSHDKLLKYEPQVEIAYEILVEEGLISKGDNLAIFGEIFGGNYFGEKAVNAKIVQRGMNYHPDTEFVAFDILIKGEEIKDGYLPYNLFRDIMSQTEIPMAPEIAVGSLEDLMKINNEFNTLIPKMFGLEDKGEENIGEGLVIKPYDTVEYLGEQRVVIKSKNSKFSEKAKTSPKVTFKLELTSDQESIKDEFMSFLTVNRVSNVASKLGEVSWKDFNKLSGLLVQDAITEYNREFEQELKEEFSDVWNDVKKIFNNHAAIVVREYLKTVN